MRKREIKIDYLEYDSRAELPLQDRELLEAAIAAISKAYAPYSGYRVGASVLLDNGKVFSANNQENMAFPSGTCAERAVLFYVHANYPDNTIKAIAISAVTDKFNIREAVSPCGSCRQVIAEYETKQKSPVRLILSAEKTKTIVINGINKLLPFHFEGEELKKH
ncbi:MAG: cytidine deaminase [Bacteroidota bacterium]|nr:cytidine deaminase [Bacteroidota bacterium]